MRENSDLTYQQLLKKEYFKDSLNSRISDVGKIKYSKDLKDSNKILDSILSTNEFRPLKIYKISVEKLLKNILPPKIMEMVIFGFYKNQKLTIKVIHPVAQYELNHKKVDIISIARKIEDFKDIKEITVFRDDRINKFSKEYNKEFYDNFNSKNKKVVQYDFYEEKSIGIFDNKLTNPKMRRIYEQIRDAIKENRKNS